MGKEYYFFSNINYADVKVKTDIEIIQENEWFLLKKGENTLPALCTSVGEEKHNVFYFDTLWKNMSNDADEILSILKEKLGVDYIDDNEFERLCHEYKEPNYAALIERDIEADEQVLYGSPERETIDPELD